MVTEIGYRRISPGESGIIPSEREILIADRNSFVRFIGQNYDMFAGLNVASRALRQEEKGWRESPGFEELIEENLQILLRITKGKKLHSHFESVARKNVIAQVFGSVENIKVASDVNRYVTEGVYKALLPHDRKSYDEYLEKVYEYSYGYRDARKPLVEEVISHRKSLNDATLQFLQEDLDHVYDFQDFLLNQEYGGYRNTFRSYLASLQIQEDNARQSKKESILDQVRAGIEEKNGNHPDEGLTEEVVEMAENEEFLLFALQYAKTAYPELPIEPNASFDRLVKGLVDLPINFWPAGMRNQYNHLSSTRASQVIQIIRTELQKYQESQRTVYSSGVRSVFDFEPHKKKRVNQARITQETNEKKAEQEKEPPLTPIGWIIPVGSGRTGTRDVELATEDELEDHLRKVAYKLAPNDERMKNDVQQIIASLRKDPYGIGITVLTNGRITTRFVRSLPIKELVPRRRRDIELLHPDAHRLRAVFILAPGEDGPIIGLVKRGIYHHEEMDKDAWRNF